MLFLTVFLPLLVQALVPHTPPRQIIFDPVTPSPPQQRAPITMETFEERWKIHDDDNPFLESGDKDKSLLPQQQAAYKVEMPQQTYHWAEEWYDYKSEELREESPCNEERKRRPRVTEQEPLDDHLVEDTPIPLQNDTPQTSFDVHQSYGERFKRLKVAMKNVVHKIRGLFA